MEKCSFAVPVSGVRTDGLDAKEALLTAYPGVVFTIPHFDGYTPTCSAN